MARGRFRIGPALCVAALSALALAACGASDDTADTGTAADGETGTIADSGASVAADGVEAARTEVERLRGEITEFQAPGPPVDATSLKGKSVWYVPLSASIPALNGNELGIQEAAQALGLTLKTCDGKFTPAQLSACVRQAVNARPAGIITNAVDPENVAPAMKAAAEAGIPVMALGSAGEESDAVRFIGNGNAESQAAAMNWIIADSDGTANIFAVTLTGSVQVDEAATAGADVLQDRCPDCQYESIELTDGQLGSVASATSSALLKDPDAGYGFPQFDYFAPEFERGARQAGRVDTMKMISTNATASQVKEVAEGGFQVADAGANSNFIGWEAMDGLLRMMLDEPPADDVTLPIRLFDETNVDSIEVTDAAQVTGEWWGPTTYKREFPKLWGLG